MNVPLYRDYLSLSPCTVKLYWWHFLSVHKLFGASKGGGSAAQILDVVVRFAG